MSDSPTPPRWVPDEEVSHCTKCKEVFGFFTRKHHCRLCGSIFCADCCAHFANLKEFGYDLKVRMCSNCYGARIPTSSKPELPGQSEGDHQLLVNPGSETQLPAEGTAMNALFKTTMLELGICEDAITALLQMPNRNKISLLDNLKDYKLNSTTFSKCPIPPQSMEEEIDIILKKILKEFKIPEEVHGGVIGLSCEQKWPLIMLDAEGKLLQNLLLPLESFDPSSVRYNIMLLEALVMPTTQLTKLRNLLITNNPPTWVIEFVNFEGIDLLHAFLLSKLNKDVANGIDLFVILEVVLCLKAVMNCNEVSDCLARRNDIVQTLERLAFTSSDKIVCTAVFDILSFLCVHSKEGHQNVLYASEKLQKSGILPPHFHDGLYQLIVNNLLEDDDKDNLVSALSFANCLISAAEHVKVRVSIRSKFINLGIMNTFTKLKAFNYIKLMSQMDAFEAEMESDKTELLQQQISDNNGNGKNSLVVDDEEQIEETFKKLKNMAFASKKHKSLLQILQLMMELSVSENVGLWNKLHGYLLALQDESVRLDIDSMRSVLDGGNVASSAAVSTTITNSSSVDIHSSSNKVATSSTTNSSSTDIHSSKNSGNSSFADSAKISDHHHHQHHHHHHHEHSSNNKSSNSNHNQIQSNNGSYNSLQQHNATDNSKQTEAMRKVLRFTLQQIDFLQQQNVQKNHVIAGLMTHIKDLSPVSGGDFRHFSTNLLNFTKRKNHQVEENMAQLNEMDQQAYVEFAPANNHNSSNSNNRSGRPNLGQQSGKKNQHPPQNEKKHEDKPAKKYKKEKYVVSQKETENEDNNNNGHNKHSSSSNNNNTNNNNNDNEDHNSNHNATEVAHPLVHDSSAATARRVTPTTTPTSSLQTLKPKKHVKFVIVPTVAMRKFEWNPIFSAAGVHSKPVTGTLWEVVDPRNVKLNVIRLENLFCVQQHDANTAVEQRKAELYTRASKILQGVQLNSIARGVQKLDDTLLQEDVVNILLGIIPLVPDVEAKVLFEDSHTAVLEPADQLLLKLKDVNDLPVRLRWILLKLTFKRHLSAIREDLDTLEQAIFEVYESRHFHELMEAILGFANFMSSTEAAGFHMADLLKMEDVKCNDAVVSTFLHYIAYLMDYTVDVLRGELNHVMQAYQVDLTSIDTHLDRMSDEIVELTQLLKTSADSVVHIVAIPFLLNCEEEMERMKQRYEKTNHDCKELASYLGEANIVNPREIFASIHKFLMDLERAKEENAFKRCLFEMRRFHSKHSQVHSATGSTRLDINEKVFYATLRAIKNGAIFRR